jgi:predicted RNase H-like HicB family nuclease
MKYEIILYWSEDDNAYLAEVPELAGCMADGSTAKEALHNVEIVAAEWLETAAALSREIPVPKGRLKYA